MISKLRSAAGVFSFEIPPEFKDGDVVGFIRNTKIYAGEVRRLTVALFEEDERVIPETTDDGPEVEILRSRP